MPYAAAPRVRVAREQRLTGSHDVVRDDVCGAVDVQADDVGEEVDEQQADVAVLGEVAEAGHDAGAMRACCEEWRD